ncbi:MAG: hypothetical protein JSS43_15625 [Proteobacteria bacterium]|nr:hypothetical protein [Pseudomonadota bacterium]
MKLNAGLPIAALCLALSPAYAENDRCALLTRQEAASILGMPVSPGKTAGPAASACQFDNDDDGYVQVQVIDDPRYWSPPKLAPDFRKVTGIGKEAYVVPEMGGWTAGALLEGRLAVVSLSGGKSSADAAVNLLRTVVGRLSS